MPMNTLRTALLALVVAAAFRAAAQPVYTFRVKVGIDRESVDSLGGRDRVVQLTEDMFRRVNRAFNYGAQLRAVYDFVVDWDAFYIYDGVSADQIRKPHPDHDYLVVMDGYKSDPRETGGFRTGFPFGFVGEIDIFQFRRVPGVVDALLELGGQFTLFGDSTENRFLAFGYIAQLIVSLLDLLYLNFIQIGRASCRERV